MALPLFPGVKKIHERFISLNWLICHIFVYDMNLSPQWISYGSTHAFSALAIDYLAQHTALRPFYKHTPDISGIRKAMEERKAFNTNRDLLSDIIRTQYEGIAVSEKVNHNIEKLKDIHTFTICTAHQPNIFTGYLYFIYKIIQAIKLADQLKAQFPENHFVPVYYMGSEDNDLEELNHIFLSGEKLVWETTQTGAVGRMNTKGIAPLIRRMEGELSILEGGKALMDLLDSCYNDSSTIQEATLKFVNGLFGSYGLLVLIADHAGLKKEMTSVFEDDLFRHTPAALVKQTADRLADRHYHAQVNPRDINLFYMKDNLRERILTTGDRFQINNSEISFSGDEILKELAEYPERFSPNVVLRGLFQETILPNIVFIGGGSEVAYWLELKELFEHYGVPYPVLLQRNSFLIVEGRMHKLMKKLGIDPEALFKEESALLKDIVLARSSLQLTLGNEAEQLSGFYEHLRKIVQPIDTTLIQHVNALEAKAAKALKNLEKKMLRAEKHKYSIQSGQLQQLKSGLFPNHSLQERVENILPYYARYGQGFIDILYRVSPGLTDKFGVLIAEE